MSEKLRDRVIDIKEKKLLIARIKDSLQEKDLSEPPNCNGYGRIRHFKRKSYDGWAPDPLPIDPACKALALSKTDIILAQVFQIAGCNWRCWYCFVPEELISANEKNALWMSPSELINLYLREPKKFPVIDLSGGAPNLTPEWTLWMMQELTARHLQNDVYLWSDDNLSNDFFFKYLTSAEIEFIAAYRNYGHVGCFKGFSPESFTFNTQANKELFNEQFKHIGRLIRSGLDVYAYVTFTTPNNDNIHSDIKKFVDELQKLDENLPLRTIPLKIIKFEPVQKRIGNSHNDAIKYQWLALEAWQRELENRFPLDILTQNIADIKLGGHR